MHCNPFFKCTILRVLANINNQIYRDKYSHVTTIDRTILYILLFPNFSHILLCFSVSNPSQALICFCRFAFLECHINGIAQPCERGGFISISFLSIADDTPYCGCTTVYVTIHFWLVSRF